MTNPYGNPQSRINDEQRRKEAERAAARGRASIEILKRLLAQAQTTSTSLNEGGGRSVRVTIMRPKPDMPETIGMAVGYMIARLIAARMIQKMFDMRFKRAFGYVVLAGILTSDPDYLVWTKRAK